MPKCHGLPSSLTEYVLVWCEDLLQDLPATARTNLARALSTMHEKARGRRGFAFSALLSR